jgi:hypothetical protein
LLRCSISWAHCLPTNFQSASFRSVTQAPCSIDGSSAWRARTMASISLENARSSPQGRPASTGASSLFQVQHGVSSRRLDGVLDLAGPWWRRP